MKLQAEVAGPGFDDWRGLHRLLVACFAEMEGRIDPPSSLKRLTPEGLAEKAEQEVLMLVRYGSRVVACGFAAPRRPVIYLGKLAVTEQLRGQGLMRQMVDLAEQMARDGGFEALELQSRVELTENHAAFAALGFVEVGRTAHEGFDRPTSITFRRSVAPSAAPRAPV
ncbi:GNAT family N-acetyltransferase [Vannielia litorea]|uniref:Acetyltransferase (GNAT) family protein n=1 Tax=Vannielia litorea TaxID=1217970 RepID=A0A1N6H108_9RHOB|nr:GNAT family N-acetyltransferase [Vannielia litorea]SIO13367.1 Acetyltransferase (GNAT) family protein [Vannielia litorea]